MSRFAGNLLGNPIIAKLLGLSRSENAPEEPKRQFKIDVETYYPSLNKAANAFLKNLGPKFTSTKKGHIETDIAAASSLAGLMILRASRVDLSNLEPGAIILADLEESQDDVQAFMAKIVRKVRLDPHGGWADQISESHQSMYSAIEMTQRLEEPFIRACQEAELPSDCYPYVAALAAVKLISAGQAMHLINQNVGKSLALYYLIEGSKTVPHPVSLITEAEPLAEPER
jgi:hypothetical protein